MLAITTDGRKIGLDQRLINERLPDVKNSKVNTCLENVYKIWNETKENKLTQAVESALKEIQNLMCPQMP